MDIEHVLQAVLVVSVAVGGWFFKRIQATLDSLQGRIQGLEIEVVRQKQESRDVRDRLDRIEEKIDRLLNRD